MSVVRVQALGRPLSYRWRGDVVRASGGQDAESVGGGSHPSGRNESAIAGLDANVDGELRDRGA